MPSALPGSWRNAVIHRFFLEGMTYTSLEPLLDRYEVAYHRCYDVVNALEERQIARADRACATVTGCDIIGLWIGDLVY